MTLLLFQYFLLTSLQKAAHLKGELLEVTKLYEECSQEIHAHRARQEELAQHIEDLVGEVQKERDARERAESQIEKSNRDFDSEMRRSRRAYEAQETSAQSAQNEIARMQSLLGQREADVAALQAALSNQEAVAKTQGEHATTARFSLQLEADRLKRDLERLEDELARARKDLDERETRMRERDGVIDTLHAENRELAAQVASQSQARLNVSDKLDLTQSNLSTAEADAISLRARVQELEQRLSKDQRSLLAAENQFRDQVTERNTLLLTIYQYMDKILGVDKTPVRLSVEYSRTSLTLIPILTIEERQSGRDEAIHNFRCLPRQSHQPTEISEPGPAQFREAC